MYYKHQSYYIFYLYMFSRLYSIQNVCNALYINNTLYFNNEDEWYRSYFPKPWCYFHEAVGGDALTPIDDVKLGNNTIFFIETSCRGGLDYRQACSVESAAKMHPRRRVVVLFTAPVNDKLLTNPPLADLIRYPNVQFYRIRLKNYLRGTIVEDLANRVRKAKYYVHQISEALRYVTLHKYGGIYLDLDVIVVKSLSTLPVKRNWVGAEAPREVGVGLLALSKRGIGKIMSGMSLRDLKENFNSDQWLKGRLDIFANTLSLVCRVRSLCKDFRVYEPRYFYPIPETEYATYLKPFKKFSGNMTGIYAFHFWNYLTGDEDIEDNSLLAHLASNYCPIVFRNDEFGDAPIGVRNIKPNLRKPIKGDIKIANKNTSEAKITKKNGKRTQKSKKAYNGTFGRTLKVMKHLLEKNS